MRILFLPTAWTILLDILVWFVLHMGISWLTTRLPASIFKPRKPLFRERSWENRGRLYSRFFLLPRWKSYLPDAAPWFQGGFPKRRFASSDPTYLRGFIQETCRGEAAHWIVMLMAPLFFLFNPLWVGFLMLAYGLLANLPCILTQRYNRIRMNALLNRRWPQIS